MPALGGYPGLDWLVLAGERYIPFNGERVRQTNEKSWKEEVLFRPGFSLLQHFNVSALPQMCVVGILVKYVQNNSFPCFAVRYRLLGHASNECVLSGKTVKWETKPPICESEFKSL